MGPLVIESDTRTRDATRILLESWGYRPRAVASAREARALVEAGEITPSVILASEITVIESVRSVCVKRPPALLVCTEPGKGSESDCARLDLRLLLKPVTPVRLRAALLEVMFPEAKDDARRSRE